MRILLLLIILLPLNSFGQREIWLESKVKGGFLIAHRSIMGHLATEHAMAGELSCLIQSNQEKAWHKPYKQPIYGATLFFGSTGNRKLLGYQTALLADIRFPLVRYKNYSLNLRTSGGLAYGNRVFDNTDPELIYSIAISSHINAAIMLGLESRLRFKKSSLSLAIDMTHFSNGSTTVPNLGLNVPFLSVGYGYNIVKPDSIHSVQTTPFKKYWEFGAIAIGSIKQVFPTGGKTYPIFGFNAVARRFFNYTSGMEVSFDVISKQAIMSYQHELEKSQLDIVQLGVFAGYLLPLDKLHLVVGMGYYVRDKYQPEDIFYHRVGMRYVFDNGININLVLKSHWARADYVEYGIGYTFRR